MAKNGHDRDFDDFCDFDPLSTVNLGFNLGIPYKRTKTAFFAVQLVLLVMSGSEMTISQCILAL